MDERREKEREREREGGRGENRWKRGGNQANERELRREGSRGGKRAILTKQRARQAASSFSE